MNLARVPQPGYWAHLMMGLSMDSAMSSMIQLVKKPKGMMPPIHVDTSTSVDPTFIWTEEKLGIETQPW